MGEGWAPTAFWYDDQLGICLNARLSPNDLGILTGDLRLYGENYSQIVFENMPTQTGIYSDVGADDLGLASSHMWLYGGDLTLWFNDVLIDGGNLVAADDTFIKPGKDSDGSLPTADASYRGKMIRVEGGAAVADKLFMCMKKADDTYAWVQIASG